MYSRLLGRERRTATFSYKQGIGVRAGTAITLMIPDAQLELYALDFSVVPVPSTSPLREGERAIEVQPCPRDAQGPWTAFSGGFLAPHPTCVTVIVSTDARSQRTRIGLGEAMRDVARDEVNVSDGGARRPP